MLVGEFTVNNKVGLHARPAGLLVKCAQSCSANVTLEAKGKTADAKRLFAVMGLGVAQNDPITFTIDGKTENDDCAKLKAFCEANI